MTKAEELSLVYKNLLEDYKINTPLRKAHFFGQLAAESKLISSRESCYYKTIQSLRKTFKTPFKGKTDDFVTKYLKNTEKCANYVYANREGNGNEASGDGNKYRGGGYIMTTFKNVYQNLKTKTGVDFVSNPNIILEDINSLLSALIYWKDNSLNSYADSDNLDVISDLVNIGSRTKILGDANGYKDRKEFVEKYKKIFK